MSDNEKSTARTPAEKRRWSAAHADVKSVATSWPQAIREARALTDDQLDTAAHGCTDRTCVRHGAINEVRHERAVSA